jgi:hypothetical protein
VSRPSSEACAREARRAWFEQARRRALPPEPALLVALAASGVGAFTVAAVAWRSSALFEGRPLAATAVVAIGAALAIAVLGVPLVALRRGWVTALAARTSARSEVVRCPRCAVERAPDEPGDRCAACGGALLGAEGLWIASSSDPHLRALRWAAAARARVGTSIRARPFWPFSSVLAITSTLASVGVVWCTAALLGGTAASAVEAPLALDRQVSLHGTALASPPAAHDLPPGPPTRPRAPLWSGTQVLARRGSGPYHELGFVVRTERSRGFVVYASGGSAWLRGADLLAPELAPGDAIEVSDGLRFTPATLVYRMGTAFRVRLHDGTAHWTGAARVRVRSDARHTAGEGLESEVTPGAWIEARVGDVLLPGLAVGTSRDHMRTRVVFADGSFRWVPRRAVRPQRIGPGVTVWVEGADGPRIVAARVGDALVVVDEVGARSWTALSRVRRSP